MTFAVADCTLKPCQHGGQCIQVNGKTKCKCKPGFQGMVCEECECTEITSFWYYTLASDTSMLRDSCYQQFITFIHLAARSYLLATLLSDSTSFIFASTYCFVDSTAYPGAEN